MSGSTGVSLNDDQTILDDLCRRAAELIAATRGPLKSVRLRVGEMSVEVEWPDAPTFNGGGTVNGAGGVNGGAVGVPNGGAVGLTNGVQAGGPPGDPSGDPAQQAVPPEERGVVVSAPLVGTFYRAPGPDARPFVEVGDKVEAGQQVAIVEAMKLMNAVTAEHDGRVIEVLVENGTPVEYGQPLFVLEPPEHD
jgi:acetyl-CoA carboxylase biotin carboxyl carrier protein